MNVETNPHNYTNMKDTFSQFFKPARIPPKEISGVNGKLLPKPSFSYTGVWGGIRAGFGFSFLAGRVNRKTKELH